VLDDLRDLDHRLRGRLDDLGDVVVRRRDPVVEICCDAQGSEVDIIGVAQRSRRCVRVPQIRPGHDGQTQVQILDGSGQRPVAVERAKHTERIAENASCPWDSAVCGFESRDAGVVAGLANAAALVRS
jgi:hypothetical protein